MAVLPCKIICEKSFIMHLDKNTEFFYNGRIISSITTHSDCPTAADEANGIGRRWKIEKE